MNDSFSRSCFLSRSRDSYISHLSTKHPLSYTHTCTRIHTLSLNSFARHIATRAHACLVPNWLFLPYSAHLCTSWMMCLEVTNRVLLVLGHPCPPSTLDASHERVPNSSQKAERKRKTNHHHRHMIHDEMARLSTLIDSWYLVHLTYLPTYLSIYCLPTY